MKYGPETLRQQRPALTTKRIRSANMAKLDLCSIDGCGKRGKIVRGYCSAHYWRWKQHGDPLAGRMPDGEQIKFLLRSLASETDECIEWPYGKVGNGYGRVWFEGARWRVHRLALTLHMGRPIAVGRDVAHQPLICHNPACFNPRHLREVSAAENASDREMDATTARGEKNGFAKLDSAKVQAIRTDSRRHCAIAADYGVHQTTVSRIKRRAAWAES